MIRYIIRKRSRRFIVCGFFCLSTLAPGLANAADSFPLSRSAWKRLATLKDDPTFGKYCFGPKGPAKGLADDITKAQSVEGRALVMSDCGGGTMIAPMHIFKLGMSYCERDPLTPGFQKIEAALSRCLG